MDIKRIIREELEPDNIDYQDIVYEDNNLIVIYPKTKEASCDYGDDTNWCTATDGGQSFYEYNDKGNLYYHIWKIKLPETKRNYEKIARFIGYGGKYEEAGQLFLHDDHEVDENDIIEGLFNAKIEKSDFYNNRYVIPKRMAPFYDSWQDARIAVDTHYAKNGLHKTPNENYGEDDDIDVFLESSDMDWIESVNIRYHEMNADELEEILNKTFEGTRYTATHYDNDKLLTIAEKNSGGIYIDFEIEYWGTILHNRGHTTLNEIIITAENETKTMGPHVPYGIQEEYKELYELLNNAFPPSENLPWVIKEEADDMGWIKDIKPLDAINQRGQYKIWFGVISEEEQNRILNILYDNGYEWTGFGNSRPTMREVSSGENFDSLFLYNGIPSLLDHTFRTTNNKSISWMGYNVPKWEYEEDANDSRNWAIEKNKHHFDKKMVEYTELPKSIFTI